MIEKNSTLQKETKVLAERMKNEIGALERGLWPVSLLRERRGEQGLEAP